MGDEQIIWAVQARSTLYDRSDPKYSNRDVIRQLWIDCASELNMEVEQVKKKWTYLRDYFLRQYRLSRTSKSGSSFKRKWPLFDQMSFLIPYIQPRESKFANLLEEDCQEENDRESTGSIDQSTPVADDISNQFPSRWQSTSFASESIRQTRKRSHSPSGTSLFDTEVLKALRQADSYDENEYFFKSLVPHMKSLEPIARMQCRLEIQNVVLKHMKEAAACHSADTSSCSPVQTNHVQPLAETCNDNDTRQ
ncbi:uncharacterized protein LOC121371635 [Gigantopelta aegis]|uniref:uncharacterized protein LOC121371635 n=1 Tax=Gigantopelta aegis TaxID=1735272 RepID=UPI001B88DB26|nr:uncharacterized protein LOC121371635 [Gigantopelta aegis]